MGAIERQGGCSRMVCWVERLRKRALIEEGEDRFGKVYV